MLPENDVTGHLRIHDSYEHFAKFYDVDTRGKSENRTMRGKILEKNGLK